VKPVEHLGIERRKSERKINELETNGKNYSNGNLHRSINEFNSVELT
jgi:hypothetical protein